MSELLTFTVGELQAAIDADRVLEVLDAPALIGVPFAPREVLGLLDRRGEVVCALDAGVLLGLAPRAPGAVAATHLVLALPRETVSLAVDAIGPLVDVAGAQRHPVPPQTGEPLASCLSAILGRDDGTLLSVIDPEALGGAERLAVAA